MGVRFAAPIQTDPGLSPPTPQPYVGYVVSFLGGGGKAVMAWHWPPTPSSTEVKERVEPVLGWTLLLPFYLYLEMLSVYWLCSFDSRYVNMNLEQWSNGNWWVKPKYVGKNMSQCHFVLWLDQALYCENPALKCLSCGMVSYVQNWILIRMATGISRVVTTWIMWFNIKSAVLLNVVDFWFCVDVTVNGDYFPTAKLFGLVMEMQHFLFLVS